MKRNFGILFVFVLLLGGCSNVILPAQTDGVQVSVSIPPQSWLVERIAKDLVSVHSLTAPGDDPHSYEPSPQQMAALTKSDLYLSIGVEFEAAWLPRLKNNNDAMKVVDITTGIPWLKLDHVHGHNDLEAEDQEETNLEDHAAEADNEGHHREEVDPHIWLAPGTLKLLAQNTAKALIDFDLQNKTVYEANLTTLLEDLDLLDAELSAAFASQSKKNFLIIHPALGYLAQEYGLVQIAVETGGQEPGPETLAAIIQTARDLGVETIFVQRGVDPKLAHSIAAQLGSSRMVEVDPLAQDVIANLKKLAPEFAEALR